MITKSALYDEKKCLWLYDLDDGYYHFYKDLIDYPDAGLYAVWSRRGPGKTYSFLRYVIDNESFFIYMKRTNDDVELLCTGADNPDMKVDADPFVPLNRDFGWNIKPKLIQKGIGAFYDTDPDGKTIGAPLGMIISFSKIKSIKGMDLSKAEFICLDEFIPQKTEIVRRNEGEAFCDFVMTVLRDKVKRGQNLKVVLFANAEEISTPITNSLELVDDMAELSWSKKTHYYNRDRRILLHHITQQEIPLTKEELRSSMFMLMKGTAWAQKAFFGDFANNDFSNVKPMSIKNMRCLHKVHYKNKDMYIYMRPSDNMHYMTYSKGPFIYEWDLNKENDQKLFWIEHGQELRVDCIEGNMKFEKYSMYDLIVNYKNFFKI